MADLSLDKIDARLAGVAQRMSTAASHHRALRRRAIILHDRLLRQVKRLRRVINSTSGAQRDGASAAYVVACHRLARLRQVLGVLDELGPRIRL